MKATKPINILVALCLLTLQAIGDTRIWTDAGTKRTIEGEFMKVDGANVIIRLANGQSAVVAIDRLTDADKAFVEKQSAKPTYSPAGPLAEITPPVSSKALAVTGKGDDRKAGLEITNNSDKAISRLEARIFLRGLDGTIKSTVPHTSDGMFGASGKKLKKGASFVEDLSSFWIKDDIASVSGIVTGLVWEDGTKWPTWEGPAPKQEGDIPVSLVMKGILREGEIGLPLIECFNHSNKEIKSILYSVHFLDGEGKMLLKKRWGSSNPAGLVEAGEGIAHVGFDGPPKGTVNVTLSLTNVTFDDDSKWTPKK